MVPPPPPCAAPPPPLSRHRRARQPPRPARPRLWDGASTWAAPPRHKPPARKTIGLAHCVRVATEAPRWRPRRPDALGAHWWGPVRWYTYCMYPLAGWRRPGATAAARPPPCERALGGGSPRFSARPPPKSRHRHAPPPNNKQNQDGRVARPTGLSLSRSSGGFGGSGGAPGMQASTTFRLGGGDGRGGAGSGSVRGDPSIEEGARPASPNSRRSRQAVRKNARARGRGGVPSVGRGGLPSVGASGVTLGHRGGAP